MIRTKPHDVQQSLNFEDIDANFDALFQDIRELDTRAQTVERAVDVIETTIGEDVLLSEIEPSAAASRALGRRSASAGDWEPLTLGANLDIDGTELNLVDASAASRLLGRGSA